MRPLILISSIALLTLMCCKRKDHIDPCQGETQPKAEYIVTETLSDTAFAADTIFRDNLVGFKALTTYDSVLWKLGGDPRDFRQTSFSLSFSTLLGSVDITFKGYKRPNTPCFPTDNGVYTGTKKITIVEQVEKPHLTLSPLIGNYRGSFIDTPNDVFTVRMEYFDSAKYNTGITGNKNFYWLSNFPKGFVGTAAASIVYPELANGHEIEMGYKSFQFGSKSQGTTGWCRAWLNKDTLTILSSGNSVPFRKFVGIRL